MSVQYTGDIMINLGEGHWEKMLNLYGDFGVLNIPQCIHDILPLY